MEILESRFAHIKTNQMKMKRKISTMTTVAAFYKRLLFIRLCCCPAQVHTIKMGTSIWSAVVVIVEVILLSATGHVLRFGFHHYFSSPNNNRWPSIEPKCTHTHTYTIFSLTIHFAYAFFPLDKAKCTKNKANANKNGKYRRHTQAQSQMYSIIAHTYKSMWNNSKVDNE